MAGIVSLHIPAALQAFNWLSPNKYSVANVVAYAMRGQVFTCEVEQMVSGRCPIATGEEVMDLYGLNGSPEWNLVALVITTVLYRLVAFVVLKASRMEWGFNMRKVVRFERGKFIETPSASSLEVVHEIRDVEKA